MDAEIRLFWKPTPAAAQVEVIGVEVDMNSHRTRASAETVTPRLQGRSVRVRGMSGYTVIGSSASNVKPAKIRVRSGRTQVENGTAVEVVGCRASSSVKAVAAAGDCELMAAGARSRPRHGLTFVDTASALVKVLGLRLTLFTGLIESGEFDAEVEVESAWMGADMGRRQPKRRGGRRWQVTR